MQSVKDQVDSDMAKKEEMLDALQREYNHTAARLGHIISQFHIEKKQLLTKCEELQKKSMELQK